MDRTIQSLLGIAEDAKRIYQFVEGDVQKEEFNYCQLLDQLVFGDKGYVDTLGQTWEIIHDPRFLKIEGLFLTSRRAVFGGDARVGRQYMTEDGMFASTTTADLEEYTEILGEGRYFWLVLVHPDERCPVRLWHERIYPDMLAAMKAEVPKAGPDLKCTCHEPVKREDDSPGTLHWKIWDPHEIKDRPDKFLWDLIKRECPNYFDQKSRPNPMAKRLFDLFRADLVGLIADYSPTPLVDAFIELETGDVTDGHVKDETQKVFLEAELLEKALTYRANMRATAARILLQLGIETYLKGIPDARLTDMERDRLLRMVYQSGWPDDRPQLMANLLSYISGTMARPYEERLKEQLARASEDSLEDCRDLQTGKLEPINQDTEPQVDVPLDPHAAVLESVLRNPLKAELFLIWVEAERRGDEGDTEEDRLNMRRLNAILTPMFTDPKFELDEGKYWEYLEEAKRLGYYGQLGTRVQHGVLGPTNPGADCLLKTVYEKQGQEGIDRAKGLTTVEGTLNPPPKPSLPHEVVPDAPGCPNCEDKEPRFGPA